jgi:DNA mismatch repair protein MutL
MTAEEYRSLYTGASSASKPNSEKGSLPSYPNSSNQALKTRGNVPTLAGESRETLLTPSSQPSAQAQPVKREEPNVPVSTPKKAEAFPSLPAEKVQETPKEIPVQATPSSEPVVQEPCKPLQPVEQVPVASVPAPTESVKENEKQVSSYRIVGEVFYSYVIVEVGDKMLIIDKHAAHERILFEQLKAGMYAKTPVSQLLMIPIEVMMTSAEVEALREYSDELERIGFSIRYARNTVFADAIPEGVASNAVPDMLGSMAGRILNSTGSVKLTRDILFEKALYQAACKAAIKAGRSYQPEHIEWLVGKLMEIPDITFCPHGRPVALELSHHTLDKQFDRTGF